MVETYDGTQDISSTVVRFTADWCVPCKRYAPLFEQASNNEDETWLVVDVDDYPEVAQAHNVRSIPTVLKGGQRVDDYMSWTRERL